MKQVLAALGDLLLAFTRLQPKDDETRLEIARLLGVERLDLPVEREPINKGTVRRKSRAGNRIQRRDNPPPTLSVPPPPAVADRMVRQATLTLKSTAKPRPMAWLERFDPLPEANTTILPAVPVPDPLFEPQWTRAILSRALSTQAEIGPLDVKRLVRGVAMGIPWQTVPRHPWPTLTRGVQALVDRNESMAPFATDQDGLVERLRAVVGQQGLEVLRFRGCPGRGAGSGPRRTWRSYSEILPRPGTAVLVVTDLGIGLQGLTTLPVLPEEWFYFADVLYRRGCPLVAFVPYRPERWPKELKQVMRIVLWDRGTSVQTIRRAFGRAMVVPWRPRR